MGACEREGRTVCVNDEAVCDAVPGNPADEQCNGEDDDCNGEVDDVAGVGNACQAGEGECAANGQLVCGADGLVCNAVPGAPGDEVCNGLDDDCNGGVDDVAGVGEACEAGVGACLAAGVQICGLDGLECDAEAGDPVDEVCNGEDDDCNGEVDDVAGLGDACEAGVGACLAAGVQVCGADGLECDAVPGEVGVEACNGEDDDCNGVVDDVAGLGDACEAGEGACLAAGQQVCGADGLECNAEPGDPVDEVCNEIDDNCDGEVDDGGVCDADGLNVMVCGASSRDATGFVQPEDGLEVRLENCVPDADTVALLVERSGPIGENGPAWLAHLQAGGVIITEYSSADNVWNAVFPGEPVVQVARQAGGCRDNLNPSFRYNEDDRFWQDNANLAVEEQANTGCGFDVAAFPGITPLGGVADGQVQLAYRDVGAGRLWLVEQDWQDNQQGENDWNEASQQIMRYMITWTRGLVRGIQQDVPEADIVARGWERCFADRYDAHGATTIADLLAGCEGERIMMACREAGEANLLLAAEGLREDVLFDVGNGPNAVHSANGIDWYFNDSHSWGFAPVGAGVSRNSCDTAGGDAAGQRMCWHTGGGNLNRGYRCGNNFLNNNDGWERLVYVMPRGDEGELRLRGGEAEGHGRVEIFSGDRWGTVCDDGWGIPDADVVCHQLGYRGASEAIQRFGGGIDPIYLDDVQCVGDEEALLDCPARAFGEHNCGHAEDAGVRCLLGEGVVGDACRTNEQCADGLGCFDEVCAEAPDGALRLVGGDGPDHGRVEIHLQNQWGTVCDDAWGLADAEVACRQLGYRGASEAIQRFGGGADPIWLDNVACAGDEERLADCPANPVGNHNCVHAEDAAIRCLDGEADLGAPCRTNDHCGPGLYCDANLCAERNVLMQCEGRGVFVERFMNDGDGLVNEAGCVPRPDVQALVIARAGAAAAIADPAGLQAYIRGGGTVITEFNISHEVYNAVFGTAVVRGVRTGNCNDNINPTVRLNLDDPFWQANGGLAQHEGQHGCGYDMSGWGEPIVPLGGWSADTVSLAYRDLDLGRLYLVDNDWQDAAASFTEESRLLMRYMILPHGDLAFRGVQRDLPVADVAAAGFEVCWAGPFGARDIPIDPVLEGCNGDVLMMACRPNDAENYTVAAMGGRASILQDDGNAREGFHDTNGVSWYYSPNYSWGFFAVGTGVSRSSCDVTDADGADRMCIHTRNGNINGGYRCGAQEGLNNNNEWERVILHRNR